MLATLLLVGLAQTSAGRAILRSAGVYGPSQPFTELYFAHPQKVARLTEGEANDPATVQLVFVIDNREHRRMDYRWVIVGDGSLRAAGRAAPRPGASVEITRTVMTGCVPKPARTSAPPTSRRFTGTRTGHHQDQRARLSSKADEPQAVTVSVRLLSPAESIDLLLPCHG